MSIVSTLSLIACVASLVIFWDDPFAGLRNLDDGSRYWWGVIYNVAIFASGFVIYFVARCAQPQARRRHRQAVRGDPD